MSEPRSAGTSASPALVVGVGAARGATADEIVELVEAALREAGTGTEAGRVTALATLDARASEPGIVAAAGRLGVPVRAYPAGVLAAVPVPNPSAAVRNRTGTPSVAEAAALAGGGRLLVPKRKSRRPDGLPSRVTCAVAEEAGAASTALPSRAGSPGSSRGAEGVQPRPARRAEGPRTGAPPIAPARASVTITAVDGITITTGGTLTAMRTQDQAEPHDLRHHGDAEVRDDGAGLTDLAVNVRTGTPPDWLRERLATSLAGLAAYPDGRAARAAVAARHGLPAERVLLTAGAAEAFVLLARALRVRRPVVVHPQFTEPEAALRDAGHSVGRVLLHASDGFRLDPAAVSDEADLVVIGNPTNPTSVLHPADAVAALARPGRVLVVDEAFMDAVPGEREALAGRTDVPGLVVLRSLTKTWGLAGLRIGYLLAAPEVVADLERAQPLWPVSTPALVAAQACLSERGLAEAGAAARQVAADRAHLVAGLREFAPDGLTVVEPAAGPFVLVRVERAARVRAHLRTLGFAVRRGDTFPGLDEEWLRVAVRDRATVNRFLQCLYRALTLATAE